MFIKIFVVLELSYIKTFKKFDENLSWWAGKDSNLRTQMRTDLQSAAFSHSATYPYLILEMCCRRIDKSYYKLFMNFCQYISKIFYENYQKSFYLHSFFRLFLQNYSHIFHLIHLIRYLVSVVFCFLLYFQIMIIVILLFLLIHQL